MIKFKRILFPTDFSPSAAHALDFAISLALEHESELLLLHVIEDISFNSPFTLSTFPSLVEYQDSMDAKIREELHKVISDQIRRQIPVEEILARGKPFLEIVRVAREKQADLIVIPTHSHPGLKHSHLGATAERVVRKSLCPVLVVRHPDTQFAMP
ncbi:MAG: universal stress protein [Acidobacteriota bacterium]